MPTQPTAVAALPPTPNPDSDEVTFDTAAWDWSNALGPFRLQLNAAANVTYANAQEAVSAATAAAASSSSALSQVSLATAQAGIATTKAGEASASADAASASAGGAAASAAAAASSAAAAAALAGSFIGTSSSSLAIGTGNKSFSTQAGELYTPGVFLIASSQANPANFMFGQVTSYNSGTGALVLSVSVIGGSGTFADWSLSLTGTQGAQGPQGPAGNLTGGLLLGALEELKAANLASATTTNVWSITGNSATLTGTNAITSFGVAPQAGAKRTLIAAAGTPITNGANLILPGGLNYTTSVGDRLEIYAETTTQHRVSIFKADGSPVGAAGGLTYTPRTANTMLTNADKGKFIDVTSGTFTQTFDTLSNLSADWFVWYRNNGSGDITIPSSDGVTNWIMYSGEARLFMKDQLNGALKSAIAFPFNKTFTASTNFIKPPGYTYFGGLIWNGGNGGRKDTGASSSVMGSGGGGCFPFLLAASVMAVSTALTVGSGGIGASTTGDGGIGGVSSIGTHIVMTASINYSTPSSYSGAPTTGTQGAGAAGFEAISVNTQNATIGKVPWGGGAGAYWVYSNAAACLWGGAGSGAVDSSGNLRAPGTSVHGGQGGVAGDTVSGGNGTAPGGAGGPTRTGPKGGDGARGEIRMWGIV